MAMGSHPRLGDRFRVISISASESTKIPIAFDHSLFRSIGLRSGLALSNHSFARERARG